MSARHAARAVLFRLRAEHQWVGVSPVVLLLVQVEGCGDSSRRLLALQQSSAPATGAMFSLQTTDILLYRPARKPKPVLRRSSWIDPKHLPSPEAGLKYATV
jgi:hypothetical protein